MKGNHERTIDVEEGTDLKHQALGDEVGGQHGDGRGVGRDRGLVPGDDGRVGALRAGQCYVGLVHHDLLPATPDCTSSTSVAEDNGHACAVTCL